MLQPNLRGMFLVMLTLLVFLTACSKDSNNPLEPGNGTDGSSKAQVKITLDGGSYNKQEIVLSKGYSSYITTENETYAAFWGKIGGDSVYVAFQFAGNSIGTFDWRADNYDAAVITMNADNAMLYLATSEGKTTITGYGNVGGKIEGTFSGKLVEISSMDEMTVTGTFSIERGPDSDY